MSCDNVKGYITVNAADVVAAASKFLKRREERITREREEIIQSFSQPRFFGLIAPRTREQAINAALNDGFISDYQRVWMQGRHYAAIVEEIIIMADIAVRNGIETVQLSSDAIGCLMNDM